MANELKTTLELDIKPFLDAIKKAANQISTLQELRPKFNTTEFQNLQRQISGFKPNINVAVVVDKRSLDAVENEINLIGTDPLNIEVLVNSEEILTSVERIRQLRSTALNIPAKTNVKIEDNAKEVNENVEKVKTNVNDLTSAEKKINFQVNAEQVIGQINTIKGASQNIQITPVANVNETTQQLTRFQEAITNIKPDNQILEEYSQQLQKAGFSADIFKKQLEDLGLALEKADAIIAVLRGGEPIDFGRQLNAEELTLLFGKLEQQLNNIGTTARNIDFPFDEEGLRSFASLVDIVGSSYDELAAKKIEQIFPTATEQQINEFNARFKTISEIIDAINSKEIDIPFDVTAIERLQRFSDELKAIPDEFVKEVAFKVTGADEVERRVEIATNAIEKLDAVDAVINPTIPDAEYKGLLNKIAEIGKNVRDAFRVSGIERTIVEPVEKATTRVKSLFDKIVNPTIGIKIVGADKAVSDTNKVKKELNSLPNQKNIKVNVDQAGVSNLSKTTGAIGGFTKQLGSGLLASFSGAAIGAAIAGFATQAVRGIGQAITTADQLQDSLKLAFQQAGGVDLEFALGRANEFAFDLSSNLGISAERSKTLLAQVVGLTGEFGATSESITKAALGIEAATGGLVKAEQAARLFSRQIGNPEDQAALETLAKRFPAIGDAIRSTTEPAERANAVIGNLSGTFAALNEDSQDLFSTLQRLGDTLTTVFGTALAPIADAIAPAFQAITNSILENQGTFEEFGLTFANRVVTPILEQIERLGPSFEKFFVGLGDTIAIIGQAGFTTFTASLEALGYVLGITGGLLEALNPLLQVLGDIIAQLLQPIVERLSSDFDNLNDPLSRVSGGFLEFSDNAFTLAPIIETIKNLVDLLNPVITLLGNIIYLTLIPALDALELALQGVLLPFRLLNGAFELGKQLASDYGFSIDGLASNLAKLSLFLPGLLQIARLLSTIGKLSSAPLGINNIGDTKPIEKLDATLFDAVDTGQQFNEQFGVRLPKTLGSLGKAFGGAGGAAKGANDASKQTLSLLEQQLLAYEEIAKVIESRYNVEIAKINLAEKQRTASLGRQLNDNEKLAFELQRINLLTKQQEELQKNLSTQFGISSTSIRTLAEDFLKTGNLSAIPITIGGQNIKFDPTDPKNKQSFEKVSELLVKSLNAEIQLQSQSVDTIVNLTPDVVLDSDKISIDLDKFEKDFQRQLNDLEFGRIPIADFDVASVRNQLQSFRELAKNSLSAVESQLGSTQTQIDSTISELNALRLAGKGNSDEAAKLVGQLGTLQNQYSELEKQQEKYNGVIDRTTEKLDGLGESIEQTISQRFRRLSEINEINVTFDLNAKGVDEQLIEIERNFQNSVLAIEQYFAQSFARIQAQQGNQVGPSEALKNYADAQKGALQNIATQRELAIRQFRLQNDSLFALQDSLMKNALSVFFPASTVSKEGLKKTQESLNSQLDLLKVNQELGLISYQDYNAKILELEKQKNDAIKQYDEEVKEARLKGLKQVAEDSLPAINNQLAKSSAQFTDLLKSSSASFEDFAKAGVTLFANLAQQSLAIAIQQAESAEEVQKLFIRNLIQNTIAQLAAQLQATIFEILLNEVASKGLLGVITAGAIGAGLVVAFAAAQASIIGALSGFEKGGYTGNAGTKEVAGVVHGQEFVLNAKATRDNRNLLEWLNKGNSADSFFKTRKNDFNINNVLDSKSINQSINTLAYTMDTRLTSLERTVDKAIRQNASTVRTANQVDVSVYSDPGTAVKHIKKMNKIKGFS